MGEKRRRRDCEVGGRRTAQSRFPRARWAQDALIQVSKDTIIRRYAPDSVKFDDAKPGTLDQIKPATSFAPAERRVRTAARLPRRRSSPVPSATSREP